MELEADDTARLSDQTYILVVFHLRSSSQASTIWLGFADNQTFFNLQEEQRMIHYSHAN